MYATEFINSKNVFSGLAVDERADDEEENEESEENKEGSESESESSQATSDSSDKKKRRSIKKIAKKSKRKGKYVDKHRNCEEEKCDSCESYQEHRR